jgi:hypothetical protein
VLYDLFESEGLYHNLSARGSVVLCLARSGIIYMSSMVSRTTIPFGLLLISLLSRVGFFPPFVKNLTSEQMEAFMVESILDL